MSNTEPEPSDARAGMTSDESGNGLAGSLSIERADGPADPPPRVDRLLDPWKAEAVEADDRKKPIPGGEPQCPLCGSDMIRHVEKHPAPRGGNSPFRVRLICSNEACRAWTVYDW